LKLFPIPYTLLLFAVLFCTPLSLFAQTALDADKLIADTTFKAISTKSLYTPRSPTKRFWRAAGELGLAQAVPFTYNRFIANTDFSHISFSSIGHNLKPNSWTWDSDIFRTNQFGHPYQGSLYFSAFRTNGYTFWQSVPAAFAGSYMWETVGENEPPSPNDFINTSFGGIVLGEMTYRLSNKLINNRQRGFNRQVKEVVGFIINPMNGLNRILDGKWGRVYGNPAVRDSSKVSAEFDLGVRSYGSTGNINAKNPKGKTGWFGRVKLLYGNRYQDYETPFSNIYINAEFGKDDSSKVNLLSVYGSLAGWEIKSNQELKHLAILSVNYDYIDNESFFYGAQSVKINLFSQYKLGKKAQITTTFATGPVILAAVPNTYMFRNRRYDYTSGWSVSAGGAIMVMERLSASIDYRGAWLRTVNGNDSHYFLHTGAAEVRYAISNAFSVAGESGYFFLRGKYDVHPDVNRRYPYGRLSGRYSLNM
jgi:hypothetical protein